MPQASEELRGKMKEWFGDPIDEQGPMNYLKSQGWKLTKGWTWMKPGHPAPYQPSEKEDTCILFLIHEWDFGGYGP